MKPLTPAMETTLIQIGNVREPKQALFWGIPQLTGLKSRGLIAWDDNGYWDRYRNRVYLTAAGGAVLAVLKGKEAASCPSA